MRTGGDGGGGDAPGALSRWLPVVVWAAVIALFSGDAFGGDRTRMVLLPILQFLFPGASPETLQLVHDVVRKLAHPTEYGILGGLAARAFDRPGRSALAIAARSFALAATWASLDELHQATLASRTGSPLDVAIDASGAALGIAFRNAFLRRRSGTPVARSFSAGDP